MPWRCLAKVQARRYAGGAVAVEARLGELGAAASPARMWLGVGVTTAVDKVCCTGEVLVWILSCSINL